MFGNAVELKEMKLTSNLGTVRIAATAFEANPSSSCLATSLASWVTIASLAIAASSYSAASSC